MPQLKVAVIPVTPFQQNCSLLWDEESKVAAVVDPGGDVANIRKAIDELGLQVEKILLTHGHIDHAGGAAELAQALGVPIEGPQREDAFLLGGLEAQGRMYGIAGARDCTPDRWLEEGDNVSVGGLSFNVLHCPGHTPGHIVLVHPPARFAVVGDVIFAGSVGRTDFPRSSHEALLASIRDKILPLGDDYTFLPGHGPLSTVGKERQTNPFIQD